MKGEKGMKGVKGLIGTKGDKGQKGQKVNLLRQTYCYISLIGKPRYPRHERVKG